MPKWCDFSLLKSIGKGDIQKTEKLLKWVKGTPPKIHMEPQKLMDCRWFCVFFFQGAKISASSRSFFGGCYLLDLPLTQDAIVATKGLGWDSGS